MDKDYKGDKEADFMEDVRQLAEQYGFEITTITIKPIRE